ncbi:hypothetical protein NP493_1404g00035 [Ridgeia piscesae]|uniref:Uncharacterized protein n=1 Tax=Ridgeia piscesae TaxID=27915 RepID=A0AAD9K5R9_RIDPI|nr:hypothetical protein NP493_1404g00035 [Ridgeia piscesae]
MLRSKVAFRLRQKHNRQGTSKPTKLNTAKLSTISNRESFEQEMDSALAQWEKESSTRRGMGSSAAGRIQHIQDISWQARQKTPGLVRPHRPGATDSCEQRDQAHQRVLQTRSARSTTAAYKYACRLLQKRLMRNLSSFHSRQDLRQDPPQQSIYPHNIRGSSGDIIWLQR